MRKKFGYPAPRTYEHDRAFWWHGEHNSTVRQLILSLVFLLALAGVVVLGSAYYFGAPAFLADLLFG